ncbi:sn-glycerol-3-phosphate ABC transporter substrate-binding protein UgpB [Salinicola endophyticus]|uniref:sn-glycerol-3-phosphate ABC transporter substrate-binding protein UgpB n=1 Tax=Salinicola endophyticus TaxID=1949083 RepID=UPI001CB748B9|nr:sn-glycerol-3-phosphate ABC transporter substrate-binding protein UgpB [Salinicola endophyticus]
MRLSHLLPFVAVTALSLSPSAQAATTITWWHAMEGVLGEKVNAIADEFNASQDDYVVKPVYKGSYSDNLTATIAAFRAGQAPAITQVFEVGTATMMSAKGAIYPVYQLMQDTDTPFDPDAFLPAVKSYYTSSDGHMLSMPFNSSTPVLYYNQDAFAKAGIETPPKTWAELGKDAHKLVESGAAECGLTTAWPSWTQLENFSAVNDLPFATQANGFNGTDARLVFDQQPATVAHIQDLAEWQKSHAFEYGGRADNGTKRFQSGRCAMLTTSSASRAGIQEAAKGKFGFGIAPLPYDAKAVSQPRNSIIGGASLWVMRGQSDKVYQGVAEFMNFLSSPAVQADWASFTGYVPITTAAYQRLKDDGFYAKTPGASVAIDQLTRGTPDDNSRGLRLGNMPQIRNIIAEQLEKAFNGSETAAQALTDAAERGNQELEQFERSVSN